MTNMILAMMTPGPIELIVVLIVFVVPLAVVIMIVRKLISMGKENQRHRLEVGKLADELQQVRKKMEENNER